MFYKKLFSALSYGLSSLLIVFANKIVLTSYSFPSFELLALGQLLITIIVLSTCKQLKLIKLADLNMNTFYLLMPLPILYFGNLLFGLGGTKSLNLPMFTVLRRFSVLITMYGELCILKSKKSSSIQISIYLMVIGALIAALDDLTFDFYGYVYIMLNNIFTAANGIFLKKKLDTSSIGEYGLLYYNSLFTLIPLLLLILHTNEIKKLNEFESGWELGFWFFFVVSSLMGFLLNYSCLICTKHNSPLTTTVIGCLKNIFVTYLGMLIGNDYVYSNLNFIGLTISALSSIIYSYLTFSSKSTSPNSGNHNEQSNRNPNGCLETLMSRLRISNRNENNNNNNIHNV